MSEAREQKDEGQLSLVMLAGDFGRLHFGLVTAAAALAVNRPVTLFFTMGALQALRRDQGWRALPGAARDDLLKARGLGQFEELLEACLALGAKIMVCEMGLQAEGLSLADLRPDLILEPGGMVSFLADAGSNSQIVMV